MAKPVSSPASRKQHDIQRAVTIRAKPVAKPGERPGFHKLLRSEQWQAVFETIETRGAELCLAYPAILTVAAGYKEYKGKKTGQRKSTRYPCIRVLVRSKKPLDKIRRAHERLPKYVFCYWTLNGERMRIAIPTDVLDAGEHADVKPHALMPKIRKFIEVTSEDGNFSDYGVAACAIQRSQFPNRIYFVGCKHVLNLSLKTYGSNHWGAPIHNKANGTQIGKTRIVAGELASAPVMSFDAQLGRPLSKSLLHAVLRDPNYAGEAQGPHHIPGIFYLHTPAGPVRMELTSYEPNKVLNYRVVGLTNVVHEWLIYSHRLAGPTLAGGFSGSPLFSGATGGRFLGMHIAGGSNTSYAIPAWMLTDPNNYKNVAPGEKWRVRPIN